MPIPILYALFVLFRGLYRATLRGLQDPETRGIVYAFLALVALGTVFYQAVENLRWVDALYFTVITLTTIGYGDFAPETDAGKLFTVAYSLIGLAAIGGFITLIATHQREQRSERADERTTSNRQTVSTDRDEPAN